MIKLRKKNPFFIFIVVLGLLIFLQLIGVLRPIERMLSFILQPISSGLYERGAKIGSSWEEKRSQEELIAEINNLQKELVSFAVSEADCSETLEENKKLRTQLNFNVNRGYNLILANIVAKEGGLLTTNGVSHEIVIDKGRKDGLYVDLGVLSEEGVIIGKIVDVKEDTSLVCLTTSPGCQLAASLQNEVRTQGITDGRLGLTIEMNYIPQLEKVNLGDTVITSGLSDNIPQGLVIGRVAGIKNESNEVWQSASIEPLLNFNNLTLVSVIIP